jgi:hypothetical protein
LHHVGEQHRNARDAEPRQIFAASQHRHTQRGHGRSERRTVAARHDKELETAQFADLRACHLVVLWASGSGSSGGIRRLHALRGQSILIVVIVVVSRETLAGLVSVRM